MPHYTQENARTRSLNDARVSGRTVPLLPRRSHTKGNLPNGQWPPFRDCDPAGVAVLPYESWLVDLLGAPGTEESAWEISYFFHGGNIPATFLSCLEFKFLAFLHCHPAPLPFLRDDVLTRSRTKICSTETTQNDDVDVVPLGQLMIVNICWASVSCSA